MLQNRLLALSSNPFSYVVVFKVPRNLIEEVLFALVRNQMSLILE
jgi:hypothetical protein